MGSIRCVLRAVACSVAGHASHCSVLQKGTVQFQQQTNKHCETTYLKASSGMYRKPDHNCEQQSCVTCACVTRFPKRCCRNHPVFLCSACRAPHIVQVQLGECMKNIVLVDFPEQWPSLLPQLAQNLHSQVCPAAIVTADRKQCRKGLITVTRMTAGLVPVTVMPQGSFNDLEGSPSISSAM